MELFAKNAPERNFSSTRSHLPFDQRQQSSRAAF
jgi:hypothetical protein